MSNWHTVRDTWENNFTKDTSQKQQGNGCKNVSVHTPVTKEQGKFGCRIGKLGYLGTVSA